MKDIGRLEALARIAAAKQEADLMAVARADAARNRIKARMAALDSAAAESHQFPATDIGSIAAQESFSRLLAAQRVILESELAELTGSWRRRRDDATRSFGRSQVLERFRKEITDQTATRRIRLGDNTF